MITWLSKYEIVGKQYKRNSMCKNKKFRLWRYQKSVVELTCETSCSVLLSTFWDKNTKRQICCSPLQSCQTVQVIGENMAPLWSKLGVHCMTWWIATRCTLPAVQVTRHRCSSPFSIAKLRVTQWVPVAPTCSVRATIITDARTANVEAPFVICTYVTIWASLFDLT